MLAKSRIERTPRNRLEAAGVAAEKQLAHYLNRSFGDTKDVFIFNDLRVIHENEVAQMDHLVLHPSGLVIIESKSVSSTISVNRQGEFTRTYEGKRQGMPSPIEQAKRQGDLLRKLLQAHREQLLPKLLGLKVLQFNFHTFPVDILVAISDRGIIKHQGKRPAELLKADQIASRVKEIVTYHAKGRGLTGLIRKSLADKKNSMDDAGVFELNADRLATMVNFLLEQHVEPPGTHHAAPDTAGSTPPPPPTTTSSTPPPLPP
ncbi:MAG: nuclease-related domain-containing protein, partial [Planctomycetota bacterium]|nr:nuclease-related domain-containing protein [Planctomycetota bacterium]